MNRLFPGPVRPENLPAVQQAPLTPPPGGWFVASGHHAIRLLLRYNRLQPGARIAVPALICPTVISAIRAEGMIADFVDIDPELQMMAFDAEQFSRRGFDLILLPHLYGLPHPRTREIRAFARSSATPLIHDAAQSFGVTLDGVPLVTLDQGGLYSFGPGKSTTAATGGLVYGLAPEWATRFGLDRLGYWDPAARFFLRRRAGLSAGVSGLLAGIGVAGRRGWHASRLQAQAGNWVIHQLPRIEAERRANWMALREWLGHELIGLPAERISCFKYVFKSGDPDWQPPPELAMIPWRRVVRHPAQGDLPNYASISESLIELSTERSLAEFQALAAAERGNA
ncbi:MAG: DegT/DnrJ/EryC1/StrS aminotransferase family protein [Magnetococcales bacterium]|nr:DegT/DnrJ/EryC1/StrS aminotransferase family protein [Magnetococcales bacterium]